MSLTDIYSQQINLLFRTHFLHSRVHFVNGNRVTTRSEYTIDLHSTDVLIRYEAIDIFNDERTLIDSRFNLQVLNPIVYQQSPSPTALNPSPPPSVAQSIDIYDEQGHRFPDHFPSPRSIPIPTFPSGSPDLNQLAYLEERERLGLGPESPPPTSNVFYNQEGTHQEYLFVPTTSPPSPWGPLSNRTSPEPEFHTPPTFEEQQ
jgi:hypothetical protein